MFPHIHRARQVFSEEGGFELIRAVVRYLVSRVKSFRKNVQTHRLRRREGDVVEREVNGYRMILDLTKGGICSSIALNGVYDEETTGRFSRLLDELQSEHDDILVLDVGANIGYYTLLEADILGATAHIHAFEPSPENVELLNANIERNEFDTLVTVHQCSVGSKSGSGELKLASKPNSHFMSEVNKPRNTVQTIAVDVVTVDGMISETCPESRTPVVVRMDVEGYERHVFEGMSELFTADRPAVVMVELHPMLSNEELDELLSTLALSGFELVYSEDGASSYDDVQVEVADTVNIIARRGVS